MKTLYIRNILKDLWKARKAAGIGILVCAVAAAAIALRPGTSANLTPEQEEELREYQERIEEYDAAIADVEASLQENDRQIEELEKYVSDSIYMKLNPEQLQTYTVQYGLQTGGNVGYILNSFVTYINDGGLREAVAEEDRDLHPEYWKDIVSCYINSNILNVTVIHYDAELCARVMEIVKARIQEHVPEVKAVQGDFALVEMESSQFVKADVGITNTQNGHRNNLKSYESGRADLANKLISLRNNKNNYIEENRPEYADAAEESQTVRVVKYLLTGILGGLVLAVAAVTLRYLLSDRLRSARDLGDSGLNVLAICRAQPGGQLSFRPELARSVMDVSVLAQGVKDAPQAVFLSLMQDDEISRKTAEAYGAALKEEGIPVEIGAHAADSAKELRSMIDAGRCLLVAESGKTTYRDLEGSLSLCGRFRVTVLGCLVVE